MNTGTPRALKFSASVCSVTVFPVPVAPAIKPWRFAILGSKKICSFDSATRMGSAMVGHQDCANDGAIVQRVAAVIKPSPSLSFAKRELILLHRSTDDQSVKVRSGEWKGVLD